MIRSSNASADRKYFIFIKTCCLGWAAVASHSQSARNAWNYYYYSLSCMISDRLMCNSILHPLSSPYHAMLNKCICVNIEERVSAHARASKMERERQRKREFDWLNIAQCAHVGTTCNSLIHGWVTAFAWNRLMWIDNNFTNDVFKYINAASPESTTSPISISKIHFFFYRICDAFMCLRRSTHNSAYNKHRTIFSLSSFRPWN